MAEFQFPVLDAREKGSGRGFSGRFGGQRAGVAVPPLRVFKEFPCFFPVNALSEPETGSVKLRRQPHPPKPLEDFGIKLAGARMSRIATPDCHTGRPPPWLQAPISTAAGRSAAGEEK